MSSKQRSPLPWDLVELVRIEAEKHSKLCSTPFLAYGSAAFSLLLLDVIDFFLYTTIRLDCPTFKSLSFPLLDQSLRAHVRFEDAWIFPPYYQSKQDPSQCLCPEQLRPLGSRSHINLRLLGKNWGAAGRNGIRERSRNRSSQLLHRIRAGWH